jgi:hypothetical protein
MKQKGKTKRHSSPQSVNAAVKSICDIMRRSNCAGALQYVPELTWILFLRILDEREAREIEESQVQGIPFPRHTAGAIGQRLIQPCARIKMPVSGSSFMKICFQP